MKQILILILSATIAHAAGPNILPATTLTGTTTFQTVTGSGTNSKTVTAGTNEILINGDPITTGSTLAAALAATGTNYDAAGAAAAAQAYSVQRANQTGTQLLNTISDAAAALALKQDSSTALTLGSGTTKALTATPEAVRGMLSGGSGTLDLSGFTLTLPILTINLRHDVYSALQTVTLASAEPAWSTDTKKLFVGDGTTPGGNLVNGISSGFGNYANYTNFPFTSSLNADIGIFSSSTGATSSFDDLMIKSGTVKLPLVHRIYDPTREIVPTILNAGIIQLPSFISGTGAHTTPITPVLNPLFLFNNVLGGSSTSTGTGGAIASGIPGAFFTSGGAGGNSTGAGVGGNGSTVTGLATMNLVLGSGGIASGSGNGGNGGTYGTNIPLVIAVGNGGAGGAVVNANGGTGGGINGSGIRMVAGLGGAGGSASGANGGNGGNVNGGSGKGSLSCLGGNGGAGGTSAGATGGDGGGNYNGTNPPLTFLAGSGGAGGTYPGSNGGNYGYILMSGGVGGAGTGSSAGGAGGISGFINLSGGAGSTSGGVGGAAGTVISLGGAASDGVNGMPGGSLALSASGTAVQNGTITWGNANITSIPTTTGTLGIRVAVPATSATAGASGQWSSDDTYYYYYGATGWRRVSGSSF